MTIGEILQSEKFDELFYKKLEEIQSKRKEIESKGSKIKRNAFTSLGDKLVLYKYVVIDEFMLILDKKSKLACREREFIHTLVYNCMLQTVMFYQKKEEEVKI